LSNIFQNWFGFGSKEPEQRMSSNTVGAVPDLEASFLRMMGIDPIKVAVTAKSAMGISTFFSCVRVISDLVAAQPYSVYKSLESGGSKIAGNHRLHYLIHTRPNARMSPYIWKRTMMANMLVYGFALSQIVRDGAGNPVALIPYPSRDVSIFEDPETGMYFFKIIGKTDIVLSEDDVIFLKDLGLDGNCGHSIVNWQAQTIKLGLRASRFADRYYEKGAFLSGIITTNLDPKNDEAARIYKERVKNGIREDQDGIIVVGAGVDYKSIARGPVESQVIEFVNQTDKDIAKSFGLPMSMLGDTEKQTSFGTGVESMFIGVTNTVIIPKAVQLEQEVNYKCLTFNEQRNGYYTKLNFRNLLRGDAKSYAEYVSKMIQNGIYTQNEVRGWDELPAVAGGDRHWIQQNMMPLDMADEVLKSKNTGNGEGTKIPAGIESES